MNDIRVALPQTNQGGLSCYLNNKFKIVVFFRSYNEVFVQTAFIPYFPSGTYYVSICDHGPDSLHAVVGDKLTFFPLTGGCSEGLGAFRFFFK